MPEIAITHLHGSARVL